MEKPGPSYDKGTGLARDWASSLAVDLGRCE